MAYAALPLYDNTAYSRKMSNLGDKRNNARVNIKRPASSQNQHRLPWGWQAQRPATASSKLQSEVPEDPRFKRIQACRCRRHLWRWCGLVRLGVRDR